MKSHRLLLLSLLAGTVLASALAQSAPSAKKKGGGRKGGDDRGLVKPTMADTIKLNVYADNWFVPRWNTKPDLDVSGAPRR